MTKISLDDVKKLSKLARIALTDEQAVQFQGELDAILGYVQQLQEIDTEGVEPTSQVTGLVNVTREDAPRDYGVSHDGLLKNAPQSERGYIKVKRMLG